MHSHLWTPLCFWLRVGKGPSPLHTHCCQSSDPACATGNYNRESFEQWSQCFLCQTRALLSASALLSQQGSQNVTDLRVVGEGGRTCTRMKPMLCRYWMYCCKKALHISCSQGSSFTLQGSASVESQLWLRSLPEAVESFERWRFWKSK